MSGECGTGAGYQRHLKRGEASCGACRDARAAYQREYRRRSPAARAVQAATTRARMRALAELGRRHPVEYAMILDAQRGGAR